MGICGKGSSSGWLVWPCEPLLVDVVTTQSCSTKLFLFFLFFFSSVDGCSKAAVYCDNINIEATYISVIFQCSIVHFSPVPCLFQKAFENMKWSYFCSCLLPLTSQFILVFLSAALDIPIQDSLLLKGLELSMYCHHFIFIYHLVFFHYL